MLFSVFLFDLFVHYNIIRDVNSGMGTNKIFYPRVPLVNDLNRDWYGAGIFSHPRVIHRVPRSKHTIQNFRYSSFSPTHDSISAFVASSTSERMALSMVVRMVVYQ
jgi:hypothetical protein